MTTTATQAAPKAKSAPHDLSSVWAYGIHEPGWYIARWRWNEAYAEHLRSIGYTVVRSVEQPEGVPSESGGRSESA